MVKVAELGNREAVNLTGQARQADLNPFKKWPIGLDQRSIGGGTKEKRRDRTSRDAQELSTI
jgi:hypothetical protein